VLVRGALISRGGLVADERRARIEGERLQAVVDDGAVLGRAAHYRRPDKEARLEGRERPAVATAVMPVIGVHEDVGAALQVGIEPARRLELEAAGAGSGDRWASDAVARQHPTRPPGLVDRLRDRRAALVSAEHVPRGGPECAGKRRSEASRNARERDQFLAVGRRRPDEIAVFRLDC